MIWAVLLALTSAAPAQKVRLAMPTLATVNLDGRVGSFYGEHFAQQLKFSGLDVVTAEEIASLLGMERQKQLLGCSEGSSSCMAELANALGTDGVVMGTVAKVGAVTQINVKVISATDGRTLGAYSYRADSDEAALDAFTRGASDLSAQVYVALGRAVPESARTLGKQPSRVRKFWWLPVAAGGVFAVLGGVMFVFADGSYRELATRTDGHLTVSDGIAVREAGKLQQTLGLVFSAVAGAAVVAGVAMLLFGGSSGETTLSVAPGAGGAVLLWGGAF